MKIYNQENKNVKTYKLDLLVLIYSLTLQNMIFVFPLKSFYF